MGTDYKAIGSSADVENINPNTANAWNAFAQMMPAARAGMGDVIAGLQGIEYDPNAWFSQWMSQMPQMQGLAQMATEPFDAAGTSYAARAADMARRKVEQQYGGGGLYSGAFGKAVGEGMAMPYLQAAANSEQLQGNIFAQLAGQGMGLNAQGQQYETTSQLQALAEQGGLWGNQMNIAGSGMASLGAPEWWQPTYVQEQDPLMGALGGALSGAATGLMTGGLPGALFGGVAGGAGGALGMGGGGLGYAVGSSFGDEGAFSDFNWWQGGGSPSPRYFAPGQDTYSTYNFGTPPRQFNVPTVDRYSNYNFNPYNYNAGYGSYMFPQYRY